MEYLKNYKTFKDQSSEVTNEGIMDMLKAATGAVKNFFSGISAPFKNFKADFQKGLSLEEAKTKMIKSLDTLQASSIKAINDAKEKSEILQMQETFLKNIEDQMVDFDKTISTVKEGVVNEGKIQDALIGGRVLFGLLKDEYTRLSTEFQTKFAKAKDIAAAKNEAINLIKNSITAAKKKISDAKVVEDAISKYKEEKKIVTTPVGGKDEIILDWGDVEATIKPSEEKPGFYQVVSTNSKKVAFKEGQKLFIKIPAEIKLGDKVMFTEMERDGKPDPLKQYETGAIQKITQNGKEVQNVKSASGRDSKEGPIIRMMTSIDKIKTDKEKMDKVTSIVQNLVEKPDKIVDVEKILSS